MNTSQPVVDRDRGDAQHHHRQRQAEVELHEAQAVDVALARRREEGDRARLGRHHRDAPPWSSGMLRPASRKSVRSALAAPAPHAVGDEERRGPRPARPNRARSCGPGRRVSRRTASRDSAITRQAARRSPARRAPVQLPRIGGGLVVAVAAIGAGGSSPWLAASDRAMRGSACAGSPGWRTAATLRARRPAAGGRTRSRCR